MFSEYIRISSTQGSPADVIIILKITRFNADLFCELKQFYGIVFPINDIQYLNLIFSTNGNHFPGTTAVTQLVLQWEY